MTLATETIDERAWFDFTTALTLHSSAAVDHFKRNFACRARGITMLNVRFDVRKLGRDAWRVTVRGSHYTGHAKEAHGIRRFVTHGLHQRGKDPFNSSARTEPVIRNRRVLP
jgi:hypothetical protein